MPDVTEVVEKIAEEVKAIGATTKKNYDELNRNYEEIKSTLKSQGDTDPISQEKLDKLASDIGTRQQKADEAAAAATKATEDFTKRMDELEIAAKRIPKFGSTGNIDQDRKLIESYMQMEKSFAAAGRRKLSFRDVMTMEKEPKIDKLTAYNDAYREYLHIDELKMGPESAKSLQVGIDVDGGYTVTPFMSSRISKRIYESDPIRQLASVETIGTDRYEMHLDNDEAGAEWEGETVQNDNEVTPKMEKKSIPVHILATHPKMTQMLIDDSNINIEAWLSNKVGEKFSRTESASFILGDSIGKPTGFGTYPAWDNAGVYQSKAIEQINMGDATKFTTDGLIDVKYSMVEQHLMVGTWLTNRLSVRDIMKLKDGDGQYIWRPGITEGQPAILLGLPFRMATSVATAAANALAIYLADWKLTYLIVDRQGINVQRDPFTKKPFVEFYTRKRVGGDVINYQSIKIGKIAV
jgi:HK97 family phage major capsid protein